MASMFSTIQQMKNTMKKALFESEGLIDLEVRMGVGQGNGVGPAINIFWMF